MTVTEIRKILESPYDRKVWKSFLQAQFTNNKLNAEDRTILLSDKTLSKQCLSLGNYEISDYSKIGIFEVELNEKVNISRNRVALRNLIKDITQQVSGAMVVFVQGDKWRFSYISKRKVKNTNTNEIEDKQTAPKRYTYLFGKNEKALTAAIRFDKLIQKQQQNIFQFLSLDDFEEAFSVEKLSKEFFQNYKATYEDFVQFLTGKRYGKKGNKYVEQVIHKPNWQLTTLFNKDEKQARDFCKRMMGRIVFLYFIQKKGWLAVAQGKNWGEGNPDYLFHLFKKSKSKEDFYHEELVNLFFKTLNNPDSEKASNEFRFPYLNGGLFDDSHDKKYNKLHLPEEVFSRMFETFNNYNFTVYEDAPDEHTVAVDPEMLGHIFENLLEDNKDKGAFYTPKEIVHYMCKESLKAYLYAHNDLHIAENELAKTTIEKIIQQQELNNDEKQFAEKYAYKIIDALDTVKICDPAIGSGAFPMGLLQEIFNAQIYLQELKGFKKGVTDADIKKHIIEESIYGVDIDAGAVDIARLRFWLSLVVDEEKPQPLPNLDFKIVCANTLIPLGKLKNNNIGGLNDIVKQLEQVQHDYFKASSEEKKTLESKFKALQNELLRVKDWANKEEQEILLKLYEFSPFEDKSCSWFDPWWMFGLKPEKEIIQPQSIEIENLNKQVDAINKQIETLNHSLKNEMNVSIITLQFINTDNQINTIKEEINFVKNNIEILSGQIQPEINNIVSEPKDFTYAINSLNERIKKLNRQITELNKSLQKNIQPGGYFDIVIGNPPYVEFKNLDAKFKKILEVNYTSTTGKYDLYIPFLELPYNLLKENGVLTYICPTRFMQRDYGKDIRKFIAKNYQINQILDFGDAQIFENAMTYTGVFVFTKINRSNLFQYRKFNPNENLDSLKDIEFLYLNNDFTSKETWYFDNSENDILPIITNDSSTLENVTSGIIQGVATGKDSVFIVDDLTIKELKLEKDCLQKILKGKDISPWTISWSNKLSRPKIGLHF